MLLVMFRGSSSPRQATQRLCGGSPGARLTPSCPGSGWSCSLTGRKDQKQLLRKLLKRMGILWSQTQLKFPKTGVAITYSPSLIVSDTADSSQASLGQTCSLQSGIGHHDPYTRAALSGTIISPLS